MTSTLKKYPMRLIDIVRANTWSDIKQALIEAYPEEGKNLEGYELVFQALKDISPINTEYGILVKWYKDDFEDIDFVKVSGYSLKPDQPLEEYSRGLQFTPWKEWLGMPIDKESLRIFTQPEIIAHCLFDMTFSGFSEEAIQAQLKAIDDIDDTLKC
jgi:hypothetical protein